MDGITFLIVSFDQKDHLRLLYSAQSEKVQERSGGNDKILFFDERLEVVTWL